MCLIAEVRKSRRVSKNAYHFDKKDPHNIKFPLNIDKIKDDTMHGIITKMVEKYRGLNYKNFNRDQLEEHKDWNDLQILLLLEFYKHDWTIEIPDEEEFFPHFLFTYNPKPLKEKIDHIVSYCYDHIEKNSSKDKLESSFSWSALDVSYLLHYFVITHPEYEEEKKEE